MSAESHSRATVLALDTSTPVLTAAVWRDGETFERHVEAGRHTGALIPEVVAGVMGDAGCSRDELNFVAVGVGPGPYTSLRAGLMFAMATGAALRRPVIGACSLDITARAFFAGPPADSSAQDAVDYAVVADARRREVYWARYDPEGVRRSGPQVTPRARFAELAAEHHWQMIETPPAADALADWVVEELRAGQGTVPALAVVGDQWSAPDDDGATVAVPQALLTAAPLYLRRPDVVEPVPASVVGDTAGARR